ncbi:hypothetical protein NE237_003734 [Protea cynaroides]|uniref:Cation-transporting P-type ATPase N-terminal domain-containing protein n=1 Tax=Protea cynaroides TaxID=273540 RepID=A0A9Q0QSV9_9MAGN|nr:hypothetical protein NE237_003734 [Protea cynaroides]
MGGISLEEIKKENVDLEKVPIEEVFESLKCSREGLTSEEGANRIQLFGPNKLEEKNESKILKFLGFMWNPLSWVMEAAAIMAIALANGGGAPPDWQDFVGIVVLLVINSTISFIEENNAGNAAAALMANLAPKTKLLRDGRWSEQEAALLVPGDIISVKLGDIIPADARLLEESLPATKNPYDEVFSGSTCKQGEIEAVVIATGVHTFFGKAAHLVDSTNQVGHFQKVLTAIGNFCIISIAIGIVIEIINGINNLPVLLIGGIPIAMPTVLSVTMAIGSHKLSQQGAITKRMTAIEEMAGMDVLCSDKTGTLTLNKLDHAIDAAIVNTLADPKEARAGITELHFFPFNPVDKRTALTYTDSDGKWHRVSKGAPEQILALCNANEDLKRKVHSVIDKFEAWASILGCFKTGSAGEKQGKCGGPWRLLVCWPSLILPGMTGAETIRRALHLGVNVKMITGDQLAIGKETGDENIGSIPVDELIEKADGFAGVFPEHKYEIVKRLQDMKHIVGMAGDGVNDAPALKRADIGIALSMLTIVARSASDIVLTEPGLSVIIGLVLTGSNNIPKDEELHNLCVSITIRIVLGFLLIALIRKFDFSPFMVLIIAILNDGTIMTISKDRVTPSPLPDSWKLKEIFATGVVLGTYMALATTGFHVRTISTNNNEMMSALYLQVSIIDQALIFVTGSRSWSFLERPGVLLVSAFLLAQLVATLIAVYAIWSFALIQGCGWGWAGVIWLYSIVTYVPLDVLKFAIRYVLSGKAWNNLIDNKTAFTTKKDFGKEEREARWATPAIAEQAKRRAEVARLRESNTLKGHIESVAKLKGLDIDTIQQNYTV